MRKTLIRQMLLCFVLGPIGLAGESIRFAIIASLLTIALILTFTHYALWIWMISVVLCAAAGSLLVKARFKRSEIDNYHLSTFVGTVSCRVTDSGTADRSYKKLLKKRKFRRRLALGTNVALGSVCVLIIVAIAMPDYVTALFHSEPSARSSTILAETAPADSYQVAPLLISDSEGRFSVRSTNILSGQSGPYRAVLELGCLHNSTTLTIRSKDILGTERSNVSIGVNEDRSLLTTWSIHNDYHSAVSPQPIETLKKMKHQSDVVIQFQPFDSTEISEAHFDSAMINTAIENIRKECHW